MSRPSTTLSDSQLMKPLFGLPHPTHVLRATDKQQPLKDLLYEGAGLWKRERWPLAGAQAFGLEKRVSNGADRHVVLPSGIRPAFEASVVRLGHVKRRPWTHATAIEHNLTRTDQRINRPLLWLHENSRRCVDAGSAGSTVVATPHLSQGVNGSTVPRADAAGCSLTADVTFALSRARRGRNAPGPRPRPVSHPHARTLP